MAGTQTTKKFAVLFKKQTALKTDALPTTADVIELVERSSETFEQDAIDKSEYSRSTLINETEDEYNVFGENIEFTCELKPAAIGGNDPECGRVLESAGFDKWYLTDIVVGDSSAFVDGDRVEDTTSGAEGYIVNNDA